MNIPAKITARPFSRLLLFFLFLLGGLLVFMVSITFAPFLHGFSAYAIRVLLSGAFLLLALLSRRTEGSQPYSPLFFSLFIAATALLASWLLSDLPLKWFALALNTPAGIAVAKLSQSLIIVAAIILLVKMSGGSLESIFLKKGQLRLGLIIGIAGFIVLGILAVLQSLGQGLKLAQLISWTPWILIFVLSNGLMEELLFRGLFLRKYETFFSRKTSNLLAAVIFVLAHIQVTYTPDLWIFLVITFALALIWGWLMQKTDSVWGSALFHAGADLLIIVGIFASYGI